MPSFAAGMANSALASAILEIAARGDPEPAAETEAMDHGDRGLARADERTEGQVAQSIVGLGLVAGAHALELGDVGTRREGARPRPSENEDAHPIVGLGRRHETRQRFPHGRRERVHAWRIVGDDPGEGTVEIEPERRCSRRDLCHELSDRKA